jgi:putative membrane protein
MIVRPKTNWFRLLFVWHGSVLHSIVVPLAVVLVISLGVVWAHQSGANLYLHLNPAPFSLIGVALAVFVSFRNNVSYDRYWEARRLWGQLLNRARDISRLATVLPGLPPGHPEVREIGNLLCAFAFSLKHQLRGTNAAPDLNRLLGSAAAEIVLARHSQAQYLLQQLQARVTAWHRAGRLDSILLDAFQRDFGQLSDVLGGCERILGTPIPYSYDVLLHRTVYFFCWLLPFGLVNSIGWATPIISLFIAYAFMALDAIASELENPFGEEPNDLPLAALSITIEREVMDTLDVQPLRPAPMMEAGYRLR